MTHRKEGVVVVRQGHDVDDTVDAVLVLSEDLLGERERVRRDTMVNFHRGHTSFIMGQFGAESEQRKS